MFLTLADVRGYILYGLPEQLQRTPIWQVVVRDLLQAAVDGDARAVTAALEMALTLEGTLREP